jgi:hypothetical protein
MKNLLLLSFLFISSFSFAQDADKTVSITVSGSGKTQEEAKQVALRTAIEQAFGSFISSKTEILNDKIVLDQITSVSNGNIKSFEILNESQLPNESWGLTLKAIVSVSKLTSFVVAKGIEIEIKGGLFALNIKQQVLNEQGEIAAINEMVSLLHEPMQLSFDYSIKSDDPKSIDAESKNWEIPILVNAVANKNIDFCANYFVKTLKAISLSSDEVDSYKKLNKNVYTIIVKYNGIESIFYLRKLYSINALQFLGSQWEFYTRLFTVNSGMDETYGNGIATLHPFFSMNANIVFNFLSAGQNAGSFSWSDNRTLLQIEQMTGYKVKPRGVISKFKNGGLVVYEDEGHGFVSGIFDLGILDWDSAKVVCDNFVLSGYKGWRLPTKDELNTMFLNLKSLGLGSFSQDYYWTSTQYSLNKYAGCQEFKDGKQFARLKYLEYFVRPVRSF